MTQRCTTIQIQIPWEVALLKAFDHTLSWDEVQQMQRQTQSAETTPVSPKSRRNNKKSPVIRFLKKCVYFKPRTFIGATLLGAILTTWAGIWVTSWTQKQPERHPHQPPAVQPADDFKDVLEKFTYFYLGYQNQQQKVQNYACPTCGDVMTVHTTSGREVAATCIGCQAPYVPLLTNQVERTRTE